jgi:hypothetical protein
MGSYNCNMVKNRFFFRYKCKIINSNFLRIFKKKFHKKAFFFLCHKKNVWKYETKPFTFVT